MQESGILACAKHFPGHGDTTVDSHKDLPIKNHSLQRLHDIELYPFKKLIKNGVDSIMIAHMHVPILNGEEEKSSCLSYKVVTDLLKKELGFKGLVFSDSFVMKAITKHFKPGEVEVQAFKAGIDIIVMPKRVSVAVKALYKAVQRGEITEQEINQRVLKILKVKEQLHLHHTKITREVSLNDINTSYAVQLKKTLYKKAIAIEKDLKQCLPLTARGQRRIAFVQIGGGQERMPLFVQAGCKCSV